MLIQKFDEPISGYWDGGPKSEFSWRIENFHRPYRDTKGPYVKIGSWAANHWFMVPLGKTEKATLGNARRTLARYAAKAGRPCTFSYREVR